MYVISPTTSLGLTSTSLPPWQILNGKKHQCGVLTAEALEYCSLPRWSITYLMIKQHECLSILFRRTSIHCTGPGLKKKRWICRREIWISLPKAWGKRSYKWKPQDCLGRPSTHMILCVCQCISTLHDIWYYFGKIFQSTRIYKYISDYKTIRL